MDLVVELSEITKEIIFATPLDPIFNTPRYNFEKDVHLIQYFRRWVATLADAKQQAIESFRACAVMEAQPGEELELEICAAPDDTCSRNDEFAALANAFGQLQRLRRAFQERSTHLMLEVLDGVGDDNLWNYLQNKLDDVEDISIRSHCSLCCVDSVIVKCACGEAAYCSMEHRMMHWRTHRNDCCCAHCGNTNSDLKLCSACKHAAFCCQEHNSAHWPNHKKECKELRKLNK